MVKKVICLAVVLGLASTASALVVTGYQEWGSETQIADLEGGFLTVQGPAGHALFAARVNQDGADVTIEMGGLLETQNTYKLPDDNGPSNVYVLDGTWMAHDVESFGQERDSMMYVGAAGVIELATGLGGGNERYDPYHWLDEGSLVPDPALGAGWTIQVEDLGGGAARITAIPEPATLALLGLGGLALIRRKR